MLQGVRPVETRPHSVHIFLPLRQKRTALGEISAQRLRQHRPYDRRFETGMEGRFARVKCREQFTARKPRGAAVQIARAQLGLGAVINAEAIDQHHVLTRGIGVQLL